ncbi:MAG: cell division protein ZapE [Pseudomonadota bacterium]
MQDPPAPSVQTTLSEKIAAGALRSDPAQEAAAHKLDGIRTAILSKPAPKRSGLKGFFAKAPTPVRVDGLYMWGGVGRGKSMLMDLFFNVVPIERKRRVHFHAFMQEVHSALHEARKTGVDDAILPVAEEIVAHVDLLCFDEMQITDVADAMIVGRLFDRMFDAGVTIVTTSNRPPHDLYKDGLNRDIFLPFIDLIQAHMPVHELVSEQDYRQGRLQGSPVYFTPNNHEARDAINALWEDLCDAEPHPLILRVKGRDVELPAFANGVARAGFFDLCGHALGPGDYLAIAEAVRVLILTDIPQLGRSNFNEARRFVTLIDALYEARVRLICSAAAEPEFLYIEGEGSFEFERTASRLREMQAEGWGTA